MPSTRVKHKIVKFTNGRARVYITDDISNIQEDETTFLNPDLSFVRGVAPELWSIKDGKIWPIEDVTQIAQIHANAASISHDDDLKKLELAQKIDAHGQILDELLSVTNKHTNELEYQVFTNRRIESAFESFNQETVKLNKALKSLEEQVIKNKELSDKFNNRHLITTIVLGTALTSVVAFGLYVIYSL